MNEQDRKAITEGRPGLPLTLTMTIVNASNGCAPIANANVEVWQCDASGNYSEYSQPGFNGTARRTRWRRSLAAQLRATWPRSRSA